MAFSIIIYPDYIEILKKYRQHAITKKFEKKNDIHIMRINMSKLEKPMFNDVVRTEKTYIHTHILPNLGNILKIIIFMLIDVT